MGWPHLITFAEGDLVDVAPTPPYAVDLLVANLPYIPAAMMPDLPVAASFEPAIALDGGPDGLDVIRRLLPRSARGRGARRRRAAGDRRRPGGDHDRRLGRHAARLELHRPPGPVGQPARGQLERPRE